MSATWVYYTFPMEGLSGSIVVDIDALRSGALHDKRFLFTVDLALRFPGATGQSTPAENDTLYRIEAALEHRLAARSRASYVGRYTLDGHRVFCFYMPLPSMADAAVDDVMHAFPDYRAFTAALEDADWAVYTTFLYPSTRELEAIVERPAAPPVEPSEISVAVPA